MLKIEKNTILAPYTTIKIGSTAEFFTIVKSHEDIIEAINWAKVHKKVIMILGGGSNMLITKKIKGLVIKNEIKGLKIIEKNKRHALIEGASGESWSKFVNFAVNNNLYGIENLFLIPGTVGAAPVQNIGAYGVELKDNFYSLTAIDLKSGKEKIFYLKDCKFSYRQSVFKKGLKDKYFILSVTLKLAIKSNLKLEYGPIDDSLKVRGIKRPSLKDLIDIIQEIRNSKLPNPSVLPNAGSFFQNPIISAAKFKKIAKEFPGMPHWPSGEAKIKLSAAWLIEQAGFKGKKIGPVAMYEKQALVLVNFGKANAKQVLTLVKKVKIAVFKKFAVNLKEEVNII